jgi:serine/threonine-protein kinase RsbW
MSLPGELGRPVPAPETAYPDHRPDPHPAPADLRFTVPGQPLSASLVRDQVRRWLDLLHWPVDHVYDVLLAVNEAATNSIEHAYPPHARGLVHVHGRLVVTSSGDRHVEVTIRDSGTWRPLPPRHENRRRGIPLMHSCMEHVAIDTGDQGTQVTMRSRPTAAVADADRPR